MLSVSTQIAVHDSLVSFEAMLKSVAFADELVVFLLDRTDQATLNLCKKYAAKVVKTETPSIVEKIREQEILIARGDWVLIMDPDEIIPPPLQQEILSLIHGQSTNSAYFISRDNFSLGYSMTHGGWERDRVMRLINKMDFVSWPKNIHSTPIINGVLGQTKNVMEHHKDENLEQMVEKTNRYSDVEAKQFFAGHLSPVTQPTLLRKWWMETFRRGVQKKGFLDGPIGLFQSIYQGFSVFISYAKLYEKQITDNK